MYSNKDADGSTLDSSILEAALKAENIGLEKKLKHAIQINRVDLAREELRVAFSPDTEKPVQPAIVLFRLIYDSLCTHSIVLMCY